MSHLAWCYCELSNDKYYSAYSVEKSVTELAWRVPEKIGYDVLYSETIGIHREGGSLEFRAEHTFQIESYIALILKSTELMQYTGFPCCAAYFIVFPVPLGLPFHTATT